MKKKINEYTFDAARKQITFNNIEQVRADGVLIIIHTPTGATLYNFIDPTRLGTVTGNVLTLSYDTTLLNNDDPLTIFYDNGDETEDETLWMLGRMLKAMESLTVIDAQMRQRVVVDGGYISGNMGIAPYGFNIPTHDSPRTNLNTNYVIPVWSGPIDPRWTNIEQARIAYNAAIRSHITFY